MCDLRIEQGLAKINALLERWDWSQDWRWMA
jgi:hypothetical protein